MRTQRGFTLLEMVLVIAILVILSGLALRSVEGMDEQARIDATQQQLTRLQAAILGDPNLRQPDGSWIANGWVNDIGALPTNSQVASLWQSQTPTDIPPSHLQLGSVAIENDGDQLEDSDVQLFLGWRGPYVQVTAGTALEDGWRNPFTFSYPSSDALSVLAKGGLEGAARTDNVALPEQVLAINPADYQGTVAGSISLRNQAGELQPPSSATAKLFYPVNGVIHCMVHSVGPNSAFRFPDPANHPSETAALCIGIRALKVKAVGPCGANNQSCEIRQVKYILVPRGGISLDLVLSCTCSANPPG